MKIVATIVSELTAIGFGMVGVSAAIGGDSPFIRAFDFAVSAYVLVSLALLVIAWRFRSPKLRRLAAVCAAIFVVIRTAGSFDHGILSGLEVVGCIVVAMAAALNWFAVRAITTAPI